MKHIKKTWLLIGMILLIWQGLAIFVHNTFILPTPIQVGEKMILQCMSRSFFATLGLTIFRTCISILISFICGVGMAFLSLKKEKMEGFIHKMILFLQSIPNVTFIILFMFWFPKEWIVLIVSLLLLFPVVYQNTFHSLEKIHKDWNDVLKIYPQNKSIILHKIYLPILKPIFQGTLSSCVSMGFKVGVMAEILSQVHNGIGRRMQLARLDVDLAGVIGWTIWLFICVFICEKVIQKLVDIVCR